MLARDKARDILGFAGDRPIGLIVEIGSWLGASARWFLETFAGPIHDGGAQQQASLICIDPWPEDSSWADPALQVRAPTAWEQFAANCWHLRAWITPVRLPSREGLPAIAGELERQRRSPDLVYVDGDHSREEVLADIRFCTATWPDALVLGDDYGLSRGGNSPSPRPPSRQRTSSIARSSRRRPASGCWERRRLALPRCLATARG